MRLLKQTFVHAIFLSLALVSVATADGTKAVTPLVASNVDHEAFLARHDMVWDRIPNRWELASYTGNGNVGFLFYQAQADANNVISVYAIKTSQGAYDVRGFTHSEHDVLFFETDARDGESITITWHPDRPIAPVKQTIDAGGGPRGATWDQMRKAPYPLPPRPEMIDEDSFHFCLQRLLDDRGQTTTGWEIVGQADGKQQLIASVHHSFPEHDSLQKVKQNLVQARTLLKDSTFLHTHRRWWHDYYPQSFLTINDPEKEAFYWIQMYKFASATRGDGPIMDLMGFWYHKTFWPMVWGDLNVELQYWTHLTANRLSVGESLPNSIDKYADNLSRNVPERWKDSAAIAALFPQDMIAYDNGKVPDMLAWILHDYWLHCQYAGDTERMRDKLFPILRKNVNGYLNYLRENPVKSDDGTIHIKNSWSPEYKGGNGQDINFTIA